MAQGAATWDAAKMSTLEESANGMARGAATWDAAGRSTLKGSVEGTAQGAATWNAAKMSTLEMSAKGMTKPNSDHWFQKPPFPPRKKLFLVSSSQSPRKMRSSNSKYNDVVKELLNKITAKCCNEPKLRCDSYPFMIGDSIDINLKMHRSFSRST